MHTAKVIGNPEEYANLVAPAQRAQFIEQNRIQHLGASGIAFSIICCDDPTTIERCTLARVHNLDATELRLMMETKARQVADLHLASTAHIELVKQLAVGGGICATCRGE